MQVINDENNKRGRFMAIQGKKKQDSPTMFVHSLESESGGDFSEIDEFEEVSHSLGA